MNKYFKSEQNHFFLNIMQLPLTSNFNGESKKIIKYGILTIICYNLNERKCTICFLY